MIADVFENPGIHMAPGSKLTRIKFMGFWHSVGDIVCKVLAVELRCL